MQIFKKIILSLKYSANWVKALDLASKQLYEQALHSIKKIEETGCQRLEDRLLKGYLLYSLEKYPIALEELDKAQNLINKAERYSTEEKEYLFAYALTWINSAKEKNGITLDESSAVDYSTITLQEVRDHIKKNFPLRQHPEWIEKK